MYVTVYVCVCNVCDRARTPRHCALVLKYIWHLPANVNGENFCSPDRALAPACAGLQAGGKLTRRLVPEAEQVGT